MADPAPDLSPFAAAVTAEHVDALYETYAAAEADGMPGELRAALRIVCGARKAQLLAQDAEALALLGDVLGAVPLSVTP